MNLTPEQRVQAEAELQAQAISRIQAGQPLAACLHATLHILDGLAQQVPKEGREQMAGELRNIALRLETLEPPAKAPVQ